MDRNSTISLIKQSILRGRKVYNKDGTTIKLPSPQTAGTETQKQEYARQQATILYNQHFQ